MGPSIIDKVEPGMRVAREEIFGPVVCALPFDDLPQSWNQSMPQLVIAGVKFS